MAQITSLGIAGVPIPVQVFLAKGPTVSYPRGTDRFTALSVIGVSGRVCSFTDKTDATVINPNIDIDPFFWGWRIGKSSFLFWGWEEVETLSGIYQLKAYSLTPPPIRGEFTGDITNGYNASSYPGASYG
jgi:hypothetical protein